MPVSYTITLCLVPQVAFDAERAKRKVGRTFLGDLEKSVLGKGKMQAVSLRPKSFLTGGWLPCFNFCVPCLEWGEWCCSKRISDS